MAEKIIDKKEKKNPELVGANKPKRKKILKGVIFSNKMQDTAVVLVKRFVKHPKYKKYRTISKKYKAHSAGRQYEIGDKVEIEECRPISKDKKFKIV